jgi:membrane fusion protein (multidrug efflux system)
LDEARSHLAVAQADIGEARAEVDVAQTNADNADRDYNRFMSLEAPARSQQQLDNATAAYKGNHAQVEQAQAKLEAMKAQYADGEVAVATAQANVKQAQDDVKQAKVNLSYCKIYAPKDGLVTKLGIQAGSYATVGEVFFSIVPTDVYVTANYKETQLTYMKPGQPVTIKIDAYPDREWHGHVDSIQNGSGARFSLMPPENATGNYVKVVQRVPVKIDFDNENDIDPSGHLLEPGLSVEPTVEVR